jgi:hypothetical protein
VNFGDIAVKARERGLAAGGTGSGKSTLAEVQIPWFLAEYPTSRVLVADTKPRFRPEWGLDGLRAKRHYKTWAHGTVLNGSVLWDPAQKDYGLGMAWQLGHRTVVAQCDDATEIPSVFDCIDTFFNQANAKRPQLLVVDELLDFYGPNGQPRRGTRKDGIARTIRAGREKGMGALILTQRPVGVPPQLASELTNCYLFRLDREDDVRTLEKNGAVPFGTVPPGKDHEFVFYDKVTRKVNLLKLRLP